MPGSLVPAVQELSRRRKLTTWMRLPARTAVGRSRQLANHALRLDLHMSVSNASRSSLSYYLRVSVDLWVGAVTSLAGAVIGGAISFALKDL